MIHPTINIGLKPIFGARKPPIGVPMLWHAYVTPYIQTKFPFVMFM